MKTILTILGVITLSAPAHAEMITINVNRVCAAIVGIPYASDNFTDAEWEQFQNCRNFIKNYQNVR